MGSYFFWFIFYLGLACYGFFAFKGAYFLGIYTKRMFVKFKNRNRNRIVRGEKIRIEKIRQGVGDYLFDSAVMHFNSTGRNVVGFVVPAQTFEELEKDPAFDPCKTVKGFGHIAELAVFKSNTGELKLIEEVRVGKCQRVDF